MLPAQFILFNIYDITSCRNSFTVISIICAVSISEEVKYKLFISNNENTQ